MGRLDRIIRVELQDRLVEIAGARRSESAHQPSEVIRAASRSTCIDPSLSVSSQAESPIHLELSQLNPGFHQQFAGLIHQKCISPGIEITATKPFSDAISW